MSASAGRVLLIFKGDYESATTYKPMDVVIYGVNSYVCLLESTGNVPTNTTYWQTLAKGISNMSPEAIGIGYGLSQNTGASKTATLADYTLTINGIVAVTFADDVPANATLNINSQGAKAIYYRGSALVANVIRGGDTVTFAYDGTKYNILCIDGGAGHEIENSAGTKLSQRDVLQFNNGLEATDNSASQKTEVGLKTDYISLADWNAMSSAEQEAYKQEHYRFGIELPDTSGVINAEYMKLLWENPNTTQAFAGQTVTLSSADYDELMYICAYTTSSSAQISGTSDDSNPAIVQVIGSNGTVYGFLRRIFTPQSNKTQVLISDTTFFPLNGGTTSTYNSGCIPLAIYGIKSSFQFKVNAIASELSTSAENCIMPDGVTPITDYINNYSIEEHVVGKWIDGSVLYEKTINCGALPNATSKLVNHNISNIDNIIKIEGIFTNGTIYMPIPDVRTTGLADQLRVYANKTQIGIQNGYNGTSYTAYVTLRYTKTS